jgi:regulator of cell morphogenesis and NO signaling
MPDRDSSLPDWVIDVPGSAAVFARFGLDASCGGKSLDYVCRQAGLNPEVVFEALGRLTGGGDGSGGDQAAGQS